MKFKGVVAKGREKGVKRKEFNKAVVNDSSEYLLSMSSILSLMMFMKMLMVLMVRAMEDVGSSGIEVSNDIVNSDDLQTHMCLKITIDSLNAVVHTCRCPLNKSRD